VIPSAASIEGQGLAAMRGARILFKDLSLSVSGGDLLELRGANGSGKSTLLRILAGLTRPAAGKLSVRGGEEGRVVHYLGHHDAIKPTETALQQAEFWARFFGQPPSAAREALTEVGLGKRLGVPGRGLSAGQKRRLALARLLIDPRPIWLLDEPAAALDASGCDRLEAWVARHRAGGGLVVAAIHGSGFPEATRLDLSEPATRGNAS
jgi:heme exporter protein A